MIKCLIIEDQPPAQRILKRYIEDMGSLELRGIFPDALQAMDFLKNEPVDLIFLDIHLPKLSGIEFLKSMSQPPAVILTTAFSDYALESYEFNVIDYLLKPFSFQRFVKAVSKVDQRTISDKISNTQIEIPPLKSEIYIKSGHEHIKVEIQNIQYISSDADYTEIYIQEKKYLTNETLRYWQETLPKGWFFRIHKSHMVNNAHIEKIIGNRVHLRDGTKLPIGRAFKESFLKNVLGGSN